MRKKLKYWLFLGPFIAMTVAITGFVVWQYQVATFSPVMATAFGISPPCLVFESLGPGEEEVASVVLMRSQIGQAMAVQTRFQGQEINGWLTTETGRTEFPANDYWLPIKLSLKVPLDAKVGEYSGLAYFWLSDLGASNKNVSLATGARLDIVVRLTGDETALDALTLPVDVCPGCLNSPGRMFKQKQGEKLVYVSLDSKRLIDFSKADNLIRFLKIDGQGIATRDLGRIKVGLDCLFGLDSDQDGLPDGLEEALGLNRLNQDSDHDRFNDYQELSEGYDPGGPGHSDSDDGLINNLDNSFYLQVEQLGQAWYLDPIRIKRYYLGRPNQAMQVLACLAKSF